MFPIENEFSQCGLGDEECRLTKVEVSDRIEITVRVALEKERNGRLQRDLIKALDSNLGSDPFGGGLDREQPWEALEKFHKRGFYGLKKSLSDEEIELVRAELSGVPATLALFEGNGLAVHFINGRIAGYGVRAAA